MAKERGAIMPIIRNFLKSITPYKRDIQLIGEDYHGTKYYEDPEARRQRGRSYIPTDPENFEQEIPAEWEAWLRYRRMEPPTPEEIEASRQLMITKKQNAAELEAKYNEQRPPPSQIAPPNSKASFPTYDDYRNYGQDYQVKIPRKH